MVGDSLLCLALEWIRSAITREYEEYTFAIWPCLPELIFVECFYFRLECCLFGFYFVWNLSLCSVSFTQCLKLQNHWQRLIFLLILMMPRMSGLLIRYDTSLHFPIDVFSKLMFHKLVFFAQNREFPVHMVRRLHLKHIQVARLFHVSNSRLHFRLLVYELWKTFLVCQWVYTSLCVNCFCFFGAGSWTLASGQSGASHRELFRG